MILLATDLDRTLLPDGPAPDDGSLPKLFRALESVEHTLVYVTGRNLDLVHDAQKEYGIPTPDYLVAEVGTTLFRKRDNGLVPEERWTDYVRAHEPAWDASRVREAVGTAEGLELQEEWRLNQFKVSYYLPADKQKEPALAHIRKALASVGVEDANVIWSVDPLKGNVGLIDVLPKTATKATALEFLRDLEGLAQTDVIYCGDSGNDLEPLTEGYRAILVHDAPEDVKKTVAERMEAAGHPERLFIATRNYAGGILEGLQHFKVLS